MVWLAVDKDGSEWIFNRKPIRNSVEFVIYVNRSDCEGVSVIELPKGSIKKLIGRELSWSDEPVELK